mgnify:CR=1 FL=1
MLMRGSCDSNDEATVQRKSSQIGEIKRRPPQTGFPGGDGAHQPAGADDGQRDFGGGDGMRGEGRVKNEPERRGVLTQTRPLFAAENIEGWGRRAVSVRVLHYQN